MGIVCFLHPLEEKYTVDSSGGNLKAGALSSTSAIYKSVDFKKIKEILYERDSMTPKNCGWNPSMKLMADWKALYK